MFLGFVVDVARSTAAYLRPHPVVWHAYDPSDTTGWGLRYAAVLQAPY
jgi:hypothetical protein